MSWRVAILGPLVVERDGHLIALGTLRAAERTLLVTLSARHGHVVPRDELAELVFGHLDADRTAANLRVAVSRLRSALGDGSLIEQREGGYTLRGDVAVDVEAFDSLARAGRAALAEGRFDAARVSLGAALDLYRGDFAEELTDDWPAAPRTRLRSVRADVADDLADAYLSLSRPRDAAAVAERSVEREPTRESAYRRLMTARYAAGQQDAALAAYERCRRALSDELGVDPLPETMQLHERIVRREPVAVTAVGTAPTAASRTHFVGRAPERIALDAAIARAANACVYALVVGEPGAGKTRLVEEVVHARSDVAVLATRCYELERDLPFHPLREALGDQLPVLDTGGDRAALIARYASAVLAVAQGRPLVWTIDDIQWADRSTIDVLHHLAQRARGARLAIVATGRRDDLTPEHPVMRILADARRDGRGERVALMPLALDDVAALARTSGIPPERARAIHERSGGNAFFVTELISATRRGDTTLPETARDAVLGRAYALRPETREALVAAAVLAGRFLARELAEVAAVDVDAAARAIGDLETHDLVRRRAATEYQIAHDLVREAVYEDIPGAVRSVLHGRAIGAIDGARGADGASLICYHAELAGDRECAFACALHEGERALAEHAGSEALANIERALRAADDVESQRRCLTLRAQAKRELGLAQSADADAAAAAALG